jgi:peptide/nickel transport system permease protein
MTTFIIKRLIHAVIVLIIVSVGIFIAIRILPGDPILLLITRNQQDEYTQEQLDQLRHEHGLDRPLVIQYIDWIGNVAHGDFGTSIMYNTPVMNEVKRRIPITLNLSLPAFLISMMIGIPAGVLCAIRRSKPIDTIVTTLANLGITIPSFWLGFILIYILSLQFKLLPVMGYTPPFTNLLLNLKQLIMPVLCLAIPPIASMTRQTRSSMLDVIRQDYIRTAWSKGLKERAVIIRHALKNGLIPVLTLSGMGLGHIIGGSVIIESVFNIPGMGRLAATAVNSQDYPYVQCILFIIAVMVLLTNLLVDILYGWLDPRIKYN